MLIFVVVLAVVVAGGVWLAARGRRSHADGGDTQMLEAELSVLAEDVLNLEAPVDAHPEARADYDTAVSRYRAAKAAMDYANDHAARVRLEQMVAEASYAMSRARAIVEGREPPPPPPAPPPPSVAPEGATAAPPSVVVLGGRRGWVRPGRALRRMRRRGMRRW